MTTTYFLNNIMGNVFRSQVTPGIPTAYHLGLSTTEPTMAGTGATEPSTTGTGYTRVDITSTLSAPVNGVITNQSAISFQESTANWGTITHYVIYDSATGGNMLMYGALTPARTTESGTILTVRAGSLDLTLRNETVSP